MGGDKMKLTRKEVESLISDTITKQKYDRVSGKINRRFSEIMISLNPHSDWFDYGNCNYDSEESGGYFDPIEYEEEIIIGGHSAELPRPYLDVIPTRWLWEDFESEYKKTIADYNKKIKANKIKRATVAKKLKIKKAVLKKSITAKLTAAELKIIKFK